MGGICTYKRPVQEQNQEILTGWISLGVCFVSHVLNIYVENVRASLEEIVQGVKIN